MLKKMKKTKTPMMFLILKIVGEDEEAEEDGTLCVTASDTVLGGYEAASMLLYGTLDPADCEDADGLSEYENYNKLKSHLEAMRVGESATFATRFSTHLVVPIGYGIDTVSGMENHTRIKLTRAKPKPPPDTLVISTYCDNDGERPKSKKKPMKPRCKKAC